MSDSAIARRATMRLSFDGADITNDIAPYFLSATYTDNEEDASDDLQIVLQDRDKIWLCSWLEKMVNAVRYEESEVTVKTTEEVSSGGGGSGGGAGGGSFKVGDKVQFLGGPHYVSSTAKTPPNSPGPGPAKLTIIKNGALHPYHVIHTDSTTRVYGWVNMNQIAPLGGGAGGGSQTVEVYTTKKVSTSTGLKIRATIDVMNWNSDGGDRSLGCGEFELDSVKCSGTPNSVTVKATSLPFTSRIRQTKQSKAWEAYNLSGIAKEMAGLNGMRCDYLAGDDPYYSRVEQYRASDIDFLSKLCHDAGLSLKATDNTIVIFDQREYEAGSPAITVTNGDGSYLKYSLDTGQAEVQYSSCRVSYNDPSKGYIEGTAYVDDFDPDASKTNQQLEIYARVGSVAEAKELAAKNLRLRNKFERSVSFTFPGNPALVAGVTFNVAGWGLWDGRYIIKQAKHTVSGSGYTVQVKGRKVLEGY